MKEFLKTLGGITLGALLIFIGGKLKDNFYSNKLEAIYKTNNCSIDGLNSIDFTLYNNSKFAFDSVKIYPDYSNIIATRFYSEKNTNINEKQPQYWTSSMLPNTQIKGLIIFNSKKTNDNPDTFANCVKVKWKNPETYIWENVNVINIANQKFSLFKQEWFWTFIPYIAIGIIIAIIYGINRMIKKKKPS